MKKKSLLTILVALFVALSLFACSKGVKPSFDDYHYTGADPYETMTVDEGITLDGVLDEDIWTNCKNTITAVSNITPYYDEANKVFKSMDVRTYFGENGIYVAFDVRDNAIYYNEIRMQTRNTGVELYFGAIENLTFGDQAMSIRVSPTDKEDKPVISFWRGDTKLGDYKESKAPGDYLAAVKVDGTVNARVGGVEDDKGYVVELALSYDLFGGPVEAYHFSASFVQAKDNTSGERYGNSFILGTGHIALPTWIAVSNEGRILDKMAYLDKFVAVDEGVTIDGKFTESFWVDAITNDKGKDWMDRNNHIGLKMMTHLSDLGVYLALDCDDKYVYFNIDRKAQYNTGAEIFVVPNNETSITPNAKQMRFNVGDGTVGKTARYSGTTAYGTWESKYFKARVAGAVKGEGATYNSSNTEGWTAEIFIPWDELGVTTEEGKSQIAIQANVYHSPSAEYWDTDPQAAAGGRNYIYPNELFNAQTNPQETFFLFDKDGFRFNQIKVKNASIDEDIVNFMSGAYIVANNPDLASVIDTAKYYYSVDTYAKVSDGGIRRDFSTSKVANPDGTLSGDEAPIYAYNGNGNFTLYFSADTALTKAERNYVYTHKDTGTEVPFKVSYDENMAVNGVINEYDRIVTPILADQENKSAVIFNDYAGIEIINGFSAVTDEKGVYAASLLMKDADKDALPTEAIFYFETQGNGVLKISVDLEKDETTFLLYDGTNWKPVSEYKDLVDVAIGKVLPIAGEGYVVEMKLDWAALNSEEKLEFVNVAPVVTIAGVDILGQNYKIDDEVILEKSNFLRFGEGFDPNAVYAQDSIMYIYNKAGVYTEEIGFSYLGHGGLLSDTTEAVTMTKEAAEAIQLEKTIEHNVTALKGLTANVVVDYVKPVASAVNSVVAYMNFDHGAEDLFAKSYSNNLARNTDGNPFVDKVGSYAGDKYFAANMSKYGVKLPVKLSNKNFMISMMVDGDAIRSMPTTSSFILFGTGNLNDGKQGFSVRMNGGSFSIRTNTDLYDNIPFDMSLLDGWTRLTFGFQVKGGTTYVSVFIDHKFVTDHTIVMQNGFNVEAYGTLGIGGAGSTYETGYADYTVGIDDVVVLEQAVDFNRLKKNTYDLVAFTEQLNAKANFGSDIKEFNHDFTQYLVSGQTQTGSLEVTANKAIIPWLVDGKGNTIEQEFGDITFGGEWRNFEEYFDFDEENGTVSYTIDRETAVALSKSPSWIEANGVKKYVGFNFSELTEAAIDVDEVSVWKRAKKDNKYVFTLAVTSEGKEIPDGFNLKFKLDETDLVATFDSENDVWNVEVPANKVEELESGEKLTITSYIEGNADIASDSFNIGYNKLTPAQIATVGRNVEVVVDFENNTMVNSVTGEAGVKVWGVNAKYDGGAYVSDLKERVYGVKTELGTDSFTITTLINVDDLRENTWQSGDGRRTTLFGTCDVDGASGFAFSVSNEKGPTLRFKYNGIHDYIYGVFDFNGSGYERFTAVFDRDKAVNKLNLRVYQGTKLCLEKEYDLDSSVSLDNANKILGIGSGAIHEATGQSDDIRFDDFIVYKGVINEAELASYVNGVDSYFEEISWKIDDVTYNYENVIEDQSVECELTLKQGGSQYAMSNITFTGLPNGVTVNNGKLVIPYAKVNAFENPVTVTATIGDVVKNFVVTYFPLKALYVDKSTVNMWSDEKTGNNYEVTVKTFVDVGLTNAINAEMVPLTFKLGETTLTATTTANKGEYVVLIPDSLVDKQGAKTITVSTNVAGVTDAQFTFAHKYLDEATIAKLVGGTKSYLNFENNLKDIASEDRVGTMAIGDPLYADGVDGKAITLNTRAKSVLLDGLVLGTQSFTMSFEVNVDAATVSGDNNEFVSSLTGTKWPFLDSPSSFQINYRDNKRVRVAVGEPSDIGEHNAYDQLVAGSWQRYTLVVERNVEHDSSKAKPEKALIKLYRNGVLVYNQPAWYSNNQYIGFDKLYLGGQLSLLQNNWMADNNFLMDNFVLYRGVMTADEVRGMSSVNSDYYAKVVEAYGVDVADVEMTFAEKDDVLENGYNLTFVQYGRTDLTGATLETPVEGIELKANGDGYKLTFTETALNTCKTAQTLTIKWGSITKTFTVTYADLEALYTDHTTVSMWGDQKTGDNYVFEAGIYIDPSHNIALTDAMGATPVISGVDNATIVYNAGKWTITIPEAQVENQAAKTISIGIEGNSEITAAEFTFEHKYLDEATMTKLVSGTKSYVDFENNTMFDVAAGQAVTKICGSDATFDGGAYVSNVKERYYGVKASVGTESFTISAVINVADLKANTVNGSGRKTTLFGTCDVNSASGFSVGTNVNGDLRMPINGEAQWIWGGLNFNSSTGYERFTFVFDRTSKADTLYISVYQGNECKKDKMPVALASNVSLDYQSNGLIGIGAGGYKDGEADGNRGTGEIRYDEFIFYKGIMTLDEIRGISSVNGNYADRIVDTYGVSVNDVMLDVETTGGASTYITNLQVNDLGKADLTGAALETEEGFELKYEEGAYKLTITEAGFTKAKVAGGKNLTIKWGEVERTFNVTFLALDNLYVTGGTNLWDFEKGADNKVIRDIKVTSDAEGTNGIDGVTFGEGVEIVSAKGNGDYVVKIPYAAASYALNHAALSAPATMTVAINSNATIVKDTDAPGLYASTTVKGGTQGGKAYDVPANTLGTESFSLSLMVRDINTTSLAKGDCPFFTTSSPDSKTGFTFYLANNHARFRAANSDQAVLDGKYLDMWGWKNWNYVGWHHMIVTFDRSTPGTVVVSIYMDGVKVVSEKDTWTMSGENPESVSFDPAECGGKLVLGAANASYTGSGWNAPGAYTFGYAGTVVTKGIIDVEAATQYVKHNVQAGIDAFEA